eukprot:Em0008g346a
MAVVHWDNGNRCNYRCGIDGKYDLRVFDSAPAGVKHPGVQCDSCGQKEVTGVRWKCVSCPDYDLCTPCYMAAKHNLEHEFERLEKDNGLRVRVAPRSNATRIAAKGIFPNAEVVRGKDWVWGDQDGGLGKIGRVLEIKGWENDTHRSIAEIEWKESHKKNVYRIGHKGKVDLQYKEPGSGGYYYVQHLPVLGAAPPVPPPPTVKMFNSGDTVRVLLDIDVFKLMQEGHGGWTDQMLEATSSIGTVESVLDNGDLRIRYSTKKIWTINPECVSKVHQFATGDVVRVIDDIAAVHNYQEDHGGWVDDMALSLGQVGKIVRVFPSGDLRVVVNKRTWTYNPMCLVPAPEETPPDTSASDFEGDDMNLHMKLLSLLDNPAVIVAAAASGSVSNLREFLLKHPSDVNAKAAGKAALHCAAIGGNIEVLKTLLEFHPNLEIEDEDGDKALHLCAYSDESESAKLLIEAGADINSKNHKGASPIIIAAVKGNQSVLRLLATNTNIKLNDQDSDGDTPLHCAVLAQKYESVATLLEAGSDPTLLNYRLFTPIHEAARIGFLPAMERFIQKFPQHVNIKKDDGYTPLHLSALNDHLDVLTALLESEHCDMNAVTNGAQTALHLATHQGHLRIIERLVGFGVDMNMIDADEDTALHMAVLKDSADALSTDTPQLKKVFEASGQVSTSVAIACFLAQEGADLCAKNKHGQNPTQLCSDDVTTLLISFADKKGTFHGSLRRRDISSQPLLPSTEGMMPNGLVAAPVEELPPPILTPPILTPPISTPLVATPANTAPPVSAETTYSQCLLCDNPVDVRFEPCGHAIMCASHASTAKKCPECKTPVKSFPKLLCSMCKDERTSVTMQPCGHMFCQKCALRMRVCFECRAEIQTKIGLLPIVEPKQQQQPVQPVAVPDSSATCMICLTEPRNTALLCGHQLCYDCAQRVDSCPVCRKFITHRIRLFL